MKKWIALSVIAVTGLTVWQLWPTPDAALADAPQTNVSRQAAAPKSAQWPLPATSEHTMPAKPARPISATESLIATREGDPRSPPIVHTPVDHIAPTAAELADPAAYQRYEASQNQRLYQAYVQAANDAIPQIRSDIVKARNMGIPEARIAVGEEKLRRIEAMRAELLKDHPQLHP
ncbi:hypothetical protein KSF73_11565 [Burkholderiaceae bacterium DAT-1]|nr:hypothetical protein [Burkholderiaceae bacterium DAT-1]